MGSKRNMPKILIFDIESAPMECYTWGIFKQVIHTNMVKKDWSMLSWSAKWLFDDKIMGQVVSPIEAFNRTEESIIAKLWELLNEADIVIAHNGNQFDIKMTNARFAINGLYPPLPYKSIDTLRYVRKVFRFPSYKLDCLNEYFGLDLKMHHEGMGMWKKCIENGPEAREHLDLMLKYNKRDVSILEELYLKIRPWLKGHPNVALYIDTDEKLCTNCGNEDLTWGGYYYTPSGRFKSFRCDSCGAVGRSRTSDLDKETKARLLLSVAA
jgi:DNA polymerase elongation subunit (family B)